MGQRGSLHLLDCYVDKVRISSCLKTSKRTVRMRTCSHDDQSWLWMWTSEEEPKPEHLRRLRLRRAHLHVCSLWSRPHMPNHRVFKSYSRRLFSKQLSASKQHLSCMFTSSNVCQMALFLCSGIKYTSKWRKPGPREASPSDQPSCWVSLSGASTNGSRSATDWAKTPHSVEPRENEIWAARLKSLSICYL